MAVYGVEFQLRQRLLKHATRLVETGAKELATAAQKKASTPEDTGRLKQGIGRNASVVGGGEIVQTTIASEAKNAGFDYPSFINDVTYIRPTRAKFLHFFYRGQEVFSEGFPNRHKGWWEKAINQAEWSKAMGKAHRRYRTW